MITPAAGGLGSGQAVGCSDSAAAGIVSARSIVGRVLDEQLHATFLQPAATLLGVDECGEMGEIHTMCMDGPTFVCRVAVHETEVRTDETGQYAYLVPGSITLEVKA